MTWKIQLHGVQHYNAANMLTALHKTPGLLI